MTRSSISLGALFISAVLGVLLLSAASAFAAGKPVVTVNEQKVWEFNDQPVSGSVNPNGAGTKYKFEYKEYGGAWQSTEETYIGAGTSPVAVETDLKGLELWSGANYRITATNSYGSVTAEERFGETGGWGAKIHVPEVPITYASEGTMVLANTVLGIHTEVRCNETSSGTVAHRQEATILPKDEYHFSFSKCDVYYEGTFRCHAKSLNGFTLNEQLHPTTSKITLVTPESCYFAESVDFPLSTPFIFRGPYDVPYVNLPLTISGETTFGTNRTTITDSTVLHLTGVNAGKTLTLFD